MQIQVKEFYDTATSTLTYIVYDEDTRDAIVIDPVMDYDQASSKVSFNSLDRLETYLQTNKLKLHLILETHAHADHMSGAIELKKRFPDAKIGIGAHIVKVQKVFKEFFNMKEVKSDGSQFDILMQEEAPVSVGSLKIETLFTPGHTPACVSYLIGDNLFTGDALFMPDYGTGRCDFPEGSSRDLYYSIHQKLYKLPNHTRVFTGHDYQPNSRELKFSFTLGESKRDNIQLKQETTLEEFMQTRDQRDATLKAPRLLLPSVQVNINAGQLPESEDNGMVYIKIPVQ